MSAILAATTPIFLIIALGYLAGRFAVLTGEQIRGMGVFVVRLALPALIVHTFAQRSLGEVADLHYLLVYGVGCLSVQLVAFAAYRLSGLGTTPSAIRALGMSCNNSAYVGFPVALSVVGPAAGIGLALSMVIENALVVPVGLALAEAGVGGAEGWRAVLVATAKRLVRTPLLIAVAVGVALSASGLTLPSPVMRTLALFAGASAPLALFVIGGSLVGLPFRSVAGPAAQIIAVKLVGLPLVVLGLLQVVPVADPDLRHTLLILSASPMLSIYTVIGQRFGLAELAAACLLGATVASFATISAVLWLLRAFGHA